MSAGAWREGLDNIARFASPPQGQEGGPEALAARRLLRYILQAAARDLLPGERVASCLRVPVGPRVVPEGVGWHVTAGGAGRVQVLYSQKTKRAFYGNLAQCASVWHDPVCAAKITERRRVELAAALDACGLYQVMVTRTFQHERGDKLAEMRADFTAAKRRVKSGKGWATFENRFKVLGSIAGTEVTYGLENGFHLHDHSLYLLEDRVDLEAFKDGMFKKYAAAMADQGRQAARVGFDVRATDQGAREYVAKFGVDFELAKYPTKRGRAGHYSAFQLLQLYGEGVAWAGPVFVEYAEAMKGSKQLVWSRGLRDLLMLGREANDQEVTEAHEADAVTLAWLTLPQWRRILAADKRGQLLEVASTGDLALLVAYLRTLGVYLGE